MKLPNVWVVEGELGHADASFAAFALRIEPVGWTLTDTAEPTVERLWPWEAMGRLDVVRNVGRTPDGRPATLLELIVNGWPVRVLVPTADLPNQTVAMLGAFAPLGHPLRVSLRVKRATPLERLAAAGRGQVRRRLREHPVFLRSPSASGLRTALVVALVLVATVVAASIAGVATSAPPVDNLHTASGGSDPVPVASSTSQASATSQASSTSPPTSKTPAVAAAGSSGSSSTTAVPAPTTSVKSPSTTKPKAVTKSSPTTKPTATTKPATTANSSPTTGPSTTTGPAPTTSVAPTTTTTRARRPPTTTTFPEIPSTTRVTRPRPTPTTSPPTTGVTITIP